MKKFLKVFMNVSLFQIISWVLLILWDYFDEKSFGGGNIQNMVYILIFIFPVIITVGYLIFENEISNKIWIKENEKLSLDLCDYKLTEKNN